MLAFLELAGPHAPEHIQVFFNRAIPVGAISARRIEITPIFFYALLAQTIHIGFAG